VLGTQATVRQPYVDDLAARFAADCRIVRHGSRELVDLAERKLAGDTIDPAAVEAALRPMREAEGGSGIDVVVLACTHFPLLADEIAAAWPGVALVDGADGIARRVADLTAGQPWPEMPTPGIALFTAPPPASLAPALARFGLEKVMLF
jgi:glutamate racemase